MRIFKGRVYIHHRYDDEYAIGGYLFPLHKSFFRERNFTYGKEYLVSEMKSLLDVMNNYDES
jgi:hypothetical protein